MNDEIQAVQKLIPKSFRKFKDKRKSGYRVAFKEWSGSYPKEFVLDLLVQISQKGFTDWQLYQSVNGQIGILKKFKLES